MRDAALWTQRSKSLLWSVWFVGIVNGGLSNEASVTERPRGVGYLPGLPAVDSKAVYLKSSVLNR